MKPIVLLGPSSDLEQVHRLLAERRPELTFCRENDPLAIEAEVALCWEPPPGCFAALPQLRLVHSVGAGADMIFNEPSRPARVSVCRIVDPGHCQGMLEYVLWGVLHFHRHFDKMLDNQRKRVWDRLGQRAASDTQVGVMGLGHLGKATALELARRGFATRGWARSAQTLDGVHTFEGARLPAFLDGLDLLICLLPLTAQTQGILAAATFARLAQGAVVINCGRGAHLVADDLMDALASGQLRGALLDVFEPEPLAADHPLWETPGVIITPHVASSASIDVIVEQIIANLDRLHSGQPLLNVIDERLGY
jgi:glyoxylate/hydroxypyruvate reductase A